MEINFTVKNLDCAHCGSKIEEAVSRLDGVDSASLNFPMRRLRVNGSIDENLVRLIAKTAADIEDGVQLVPMEDGAQAADHDHHGHSHHHDHDGCCGHDHDHGHSHGHDDDDDGIFHEILPIIIGVALFAAAIVCGHFIDILPLTLSLYGAAYVILGWNVLGATVRNIKKLRFFDENTLMTVATLGAFAIGEFSEAVGVVLFFRIGELFEDVAVARSRKAITEVASLKVTEADVLTDGEFRRVSADSIKVGDVLRIKNGERVAADGVVLSGESRIDTSAVNGEPVPVTVRPGDTVLSGCINLANTVTMRATAAAEDSMLSKIAKAVEDASAGKPQIDRFITRFSRIYTPFVIAAAALTAVVPSLITGQWSRWIHSALTFLVISCPCALVLSVPLAYFSAIGAASKLGILFKGGASVEALGKVKAVAFDKTGTLTNGSFTVTEITRFADISENELLRLCGSCEQISGHPVAESITGRCRELGLELVQPEDSGELAGRGVKAVIEGDRICCGNERLMEEEGCRVPDDLKNTAGSVVYVAKNGEALGRIVVSDSVKQTSAEAVSQLRSMGIQTAMLTGDKETNARLTASELGIENVCGGLMPEQKLEEIEKLRERFGAVMFVGDGINDGPVLAGADVGGAMQTGADLALEAADVVLMNSEPMAVVRAKKIADRALRVSYENIVFALAIKAAVLVLGLLGHPNMWLAVFADSGTAMLLILNSVRLLRVRRN